MSYLACADSEALLTNAFLQASLPFSCTDDYTAAIAITVAAAVHEA